MKIRVLGSGAVGGFPQWNCNCHNCHGLRHRTLNGTA
ncbi:MAG: pyrroloquinoline quinone biosynthesis protein B, partial [Methylococcaceae bacterium]|nr:pyrroloquinoline quinone biosynthesis protein B [Methylococcaceae bacterium]